MLSSRERNPQGRAPAGRGMRPIPARIGSEGVRSFCERLSPGESPLVLPVRPAPHAKALGCFDAVSQQIARRGGSACYGWQLWEWRGVLLEAEFHAVWRDGEGTVHDITPKRDTVSAILFMPDPVRRFDGRRVANVYQPLCSHPAVDGFIRACEEEFELATRGVRAVQRAFTLPSWEMQEWRAIVERKLACAKALGMS